MSHKIVSPTVAYDRDNEKSIKGTFAHTIVVQISQMSDEETIPQTFRDIAKANVIEDLVKLGSKLRYDFLFDDTLCQARAKSILDEAKHTSFQIEGFNNISLFGGAVPIGGWIMSKNHTYTTHGSLIDALISTLFGSSDIFHCFSIMTTAEDIDNITKRDKFICLDFNSTNLARMPVKSIDTDVCHETLNAKRQEIIPKWVDKEKGVGFMQIMIADSKNHLEAILAAKYGAKLVCICDDKFESLHVPANRKNLYNPFKLNEQNHIVDPIVNVIPHSLSDVLQLIPLSNSFKK